MLSGGLSALKDNYTQLSIIIPSYLQTIGKMGKMFERFRMQYVCTRAQLLRVDSAIRWVNPYPADKLMLNTFIHSIRIYVTDSTRGQMNERVIHKPLQCDHIKYMKIYEPLYFDHIDAL